MWAQKTDDPYENLYMTTLTEVAANDMPRALKIADSMTVAATTPQHEGRSIMLTASLYMQQSKYNESIKFAEKAKDILDTTDNYELQAKIRGLLATEYRIIGLLHQSKKYADEGIKIADKINDAKKQAQVKSLFLQELAYYEINNNKNYTAAIAYLTQSLEYCSKIPEDQINLGRTHQMLGEVYCFYLNNYSLAEKHYQIALKNLPESYYVIALVQEGLGKVRFSQKRYDEAENFFLKALKFAETTDHPEMKRRIYNDISEYYEKTGQYKKAAVYRKKLAELNWVEAEKHSHTVDSDYNKIENENQQYAIWDSSKNIAIGIASLLILSLIVIFIINKKKQKAEYLKFKTIIDHYKEKEEYVLETKIETSALDESEEERSSDEIDVKNKQTDIAINKETETKILEYLDQFEKDEMFNQSYISLSFLATEFNTNSKYISYVVKKYKNTDFKNYVNKLRINYIIHKLNTSEKHRKYKMGALAEECGFSSHSAFATIFKSITGISPSTFISFIEQEKVKKI
ncbi:hypothetical protein A0O34_04515 [Chryseobacterium glaciei]|uniref:HTH araC/xylS-type domain-containing protein n=2 Tax=Chryseobacterium glaciei TaxID=1685010 RepID=A0A172XSN2_9FLAO|nr:hypothetical protein A0O34_04515 [Chryseobacterium glaciei]